MKLLHVVATPRSHSSNTLRVANAFLEGMYAKYPDLEVEVLDLFNVDLPSVAGDNIEAKYKLIAGSVVDKHHEDSWKQIEEFIEHFMAADAYLLTVPMWNFSVPYTLKYYIDCIIQPGYTFYYTEQGQPVGMCTNKKMVCVTSRGGDYSKDSPNHVYDFQEPYLRAIFGWIGITDIEFVNAQPMDITPEMRQAGIRQAIDAAGALAAKFDWSDGSEPGQTDDLTGLKPRPL